jgi:glyoxylase-like metal-dependent hydrolase (beta-lactamase superfamily II)
MRARAFRQWLCAATLAVAAAGAAAQASAPAAIALSPERVGERAWYFRGEAGMASAANRGFMSNAGFVVTREGVVVFDALGTPALGAGIVNAIRAVTDQPIRRVVVSHYHADHVYGLAPLKAAGAEIWAHRRSLDYFTSGSAAERLAQRRADLFPWVDETTELVKPDVLVDGDTAFRMGGTSFRILDTGGAHAPDDIMLLVEDDRLLFAGDLLFAGRIPFVGNADSKRWLAAIERLIPLRPTVVVPGHGPASRDVARDLATTRDYLVYLRETMGRAARELEPFDDAYAKTDWSRFRAMPAFEPANRINAWGTYLRMEQETLDAGSR